MKHIDSYRFGTTPYVGTQCFEWPSSGPNHSVRMGDVYDFEYNDPFSLFTWIKTTTIVDTIISKCEPTGGTQRGYILQLQAAGRLRILIINDATANRFIQVDSTLSYNDGNWHLVGFTYSGNNLASGVNVYADGSAVAVSVIRNTLGTNTILNNIEFNLGARNNTTNLYEGRMSNAYVFNKALNGAEVTELYNAGTPIESNLLSFAADCIGHWRMDESDDPLGVVTDQTGNNNGTSFGNLSLVNDYP